MKFDLYKLVVYRELAQDELIQLLHGVINDNTRSEENYYSLIHQLVLKNTGVFSYCIERIIRTQNQLTIRMEKDDCRLTDGEYGLLMNDLSILKELLTIDLFAISQSLRDPYHMLPRLQKEVSSPMIKAYYDYFIHLTSELERRDCDEFLNLIKRFGIGDFAFFQAYYYDEASVFQPIPDFHPLPWEEIYGYQYQKEMIMQNTVALIQGKPFHNVLLVGSSGTGKSSSVKAIVDHFCDQKLKLIQVQKGQLKKLRGVLEVIGGRNYKFILFIDDLSFEANEDEYKLLKSMIEGGVLSKNENVAFYVTSNRRHLIKEMRNERENEIHLNDSIQEMTSLSGRFGLTLFFEGLDQIRFFDMVEKMARSHNLEFELPELQKKAKQWSLEHGGMSGRIAMQFIRSMISETL